MIYHNNESSTTTDGINNFINIKYDQDLMNITCEFLNEPYDSIKECIVNLTYGSLCENEFDIVGTGDSITVSLPDIIGDASDYCFNVTASSDNTTVVVERTRNQPIPSGNTINFVFQTILLLS